jgi:SAM-dependent methyltransferase
VESPSGSGLLAAQIDGVDTSNAAFVGRASGPPATAVEVRSLGDYDRAFGSADGELRRAVRLFFDNGGRRAAVAGTPGQLADGLDLLTNVRFSILAIPDSGGLDPADAAAFLIDAVDLCEERRAFLVVDPPAVLARKRKKGEAFSSSCAHSLKCLSGPAAVSSEPVRRVVPSSSQSWHNFGEAAEAYELGRPGWPFEVTTVGEVPLSATVLDLAAGTGKLTRLLVTRFARVVALEPLDPMRAILERLVPEAESLAGSAEAIPLPEASVSAVYVAEAFHWFGGDPVVVAEIARVLARGGLLAVMWNERAGPSEPPLPDAFRERVNRRLAHGSWPYANDRWRPAVEAGSFGPIRKESFLHEQVVDGDTILAGAASSSTIASLADDERALELAALSETLPKGEWRRKLRADVYWTRRR